MISNDPLSLSSNPSHGERAHRLPRPPVNEDTLKSSKIQIERKTFVLALKENARGRFLRITEDVGGRRDTIIIPAPGLEEFRQVLDEIIKISDETPPKTT
jgi:hypothetical protein